MNNIFYDIAFSFNYDNPFPDDGGKMKLNNLKKIIKQSLTINIDDIINNIKFYDLNPTLQKIYNEEREKPINETFMINDIKSIILGIPQLKYFNSWVDQYSFLPEPNNLNQQIQQTGGNNEETTNKETINEINNEPEDKKQIKQVEPPEDQKLESIIPINSFKFDYSKTAGLTNYDITSEKPLSYEDIRKLTVNIARSKLKNTIEKSEQVLALEKEKRKQLMANIQKYKNIKVIGIMVEDDIQNMNLDQLEHTLTTCEKLFQSQKLKEMIKRGANFGSLLTSTIFPNGIKIGKNKRIKTKGAMKTIIDNVFDSQSTIGVAFQNIVEKHNWNITDEMVLMLSLGEMLISNIKVEQTNEEPPEDKTNKQQPPQQETINTENIITNEYNEEEAYDYYTEDE